MQVTTRQPVEFLFFFLSFLFFYAEALKIPSPEKKGYLLHMTILRPVYLSNTRTTLISPVTHSAQPPHDPGVRYSAPCLASHVLDQGV